MNVGGTQVVGSASGKGRHGALIRRGWPSSLQTYIYSVVSKFLSQGFSLRAHSPRRARFDSWKNELRMIELLISQTRLPEFPDIPIPHAR